MKVEGNYVDSHGQSEIGFGITRLLGFDLLPRIKQINKVRLYRPTTGQPEAYPQLTSALTRPIRWDLVEQNYDQMIKYATAIRQGRMASIFLSACSNCGASSSLSNFCSASHPTYQAMLEVGRAQRTIFVARYLRSRELQREITEGLNVVEAFNGANSVIYYGKGGEIASNRQDEQEMTVLCLRILQAALVYVNTLMLQDVLAEHDWTDLLTLEDRRGLTPLFWQHVLPYGEVKLDMNARLEIGAAEPADRRYGTRAGERTPRERFRPSRRSGHCLWLRLLRGIGGIRLTGCELRAGAGAGAGEPKAALAREFGISRETVYQYLRAADT